MKTNYFLPVFIFFAFSLSDSAVGQERYTPNTLTLGKNAISPSATLSDIAWLAGHWRGPDKLSDEIWSPPRAGMMMGMFRLVQEDAVIFYEFMTISEEKSSLVLKIKHFNPDLTGWEARDEAAIFPLVKKTPKAIYFDGITYEQMGENRLRVFVAMEKQDGSISEGHFVFHRIE